MKRQAKQAIVFALGWQVRRLRKKNDITIIAVVGSVGKSSTKRAIAQYAAGAKKVRYQDGNYNDIVSVPFVFFGGTLPRLYSPFAWVWAFLRNELIILRKYPYEVVVLELGTDAPGQIKDFSSYLDVDIAVVTAIAPEHMQSFEDLDAVAGEELSVLSFSKAVAVNVDDIPGRYLKKINSSKSYGTTDKATVRVESKPNHVTIHHKNKTITVDTPLIGVHMHKTLGAAYLVGDMLELQSVDSAKQLAQVSAMPGRMQALPLARGATAIDDTYNASPDSVKMALEMLYVADARNKIAVLGNMNEMGHHSQDAHKEVGAHCDAQHLDEVIVIGADAERYLAPVAKANGIAVTIFKSPYEVADYLKPKLSSSTLILFKGSQNSVFLEEAIKPLLRKPQDANKLVRQSKAWLKLKHEQFSLN